MFFFHRLLLMNYSLFKLIPLKALTRIHYPVPCHEWIFFLLFFLITSKCLFFASSLLFFMVQGCYLSWFGMHRLLPLPLAHLSAMEWDHISKVLASQNFLHIFMSSF